MARIIADGFKPDDWFGGAAAAGGRVAGFCSP
jgi:hypothetical protein